MDDFGMILLILAVVAVLAYSWMKQRNSPAPPGSYDDPDIDSGGSIGGGGQRRYDDPEIDSGGSFGGSGSRDRSASARTYDDPDVRSGGSIGGQRREQPPTRSASPPAVERRERPRHDDPDIKSGGSFGG